MAAETMRAVALSDFERGPSIRQLPKPRVGPGEILVRVRAASLNAFDAAVVGGFLKDVMEHRFPVVLGSDFAGTVEAVGEGVTRFAVGDDVLGMPPMAMHLEQGTFAEYVAVPEDGFVTTKPENLDFPAAAALGLAGTAAKVAVDAVAPSEGDSVLIVGATGGVGSIAVQLAAARGARVIATGLPQDEETLRGLGAAEIVDYTGDITAGVRANHPEGIAGLIDLVSRDADSFAVLAELVRSGGAATSSLGAADPEALAARDVTAVNLMAKSDPHAFHAVVEAAADGTIRVPVGRVLALEEIQEGLGLIASGQARGKLCVLID